MPTPRFPILTEREVELSAMPPHSGQERRRGEGEGGMTTFSLSPTKIGRPIFDPVPSTPRSLPENCLRLVMRSSNSFKQILPKFESMNKQVRQNRHRRVCSGKGSRKNSYKLQKIEAVLLYVIQRPTTASLSLAMTGNYGPNDSKRTTSISPSVVTCIFASFVCENEAEVRQLFTEMRNINS